jgi:hypothetical protein
MNLEFEKADEKKTEELEDNDGYVENLDRYQCFSLKYSKKNGLEAQSHDASLISNSIILSNSKNNSHRKTNS